MRVLLAAILLALPFASGSGPACPTHLVIDSRAHGQVEPSTQQTTVGFCQKIQGGPVPTSQEKRFLAPQVDNVSVRYLGDFDPPIPTLFANLNGLGFVNLPVTLTRTPFPLGGFYYDMGGWLPLPPNAQGSLTASVALPGGVTEEITYQTLF